MSDLSVFFVQAAEEVEEVMISKRFKDGAGEAVPWKLRSMTESENQAIRKAATRSVKGKNGARTQETDANEYMVKLAAASVVYPNLRDKGLQDAYSVFGAEDLLRKMLLPGEYGTLIQKVQEINGFDQDMEEMIDDVKNG